MYLKWKLIALSVTFNLGVCFYSHALASSPVSERSLVVKSHKVTTSHKVTKRHKVTISRKVARHHRVTKSHYQVAENHPVAVTVLAGGGATNIGNNHHIVFPSGSFRTDTFTTNDQPINVAAAIGVSYHFPLDQKKHKRLLRDITLGVNGYYNQSVLNGNALEYDLPNMANSYYDLRLQTGRLMVDAELDFQSSWASVIPFMELGIGVASNTLYFKTTPVSDTCPTGGDYVLDDHTHFQFAYEVGAGIKVPIKKQIILSARYLYANAGQAKSNRSDADSGVSLAKPIVLDVSSQSILFGISYLIG